MNAPDAGTIQASHLLLATDLSPRCDRATDLCVTHAPAPVTVTAPDGTPIFGRTSSCHHWKETLHG